MSLLLILVNFIIFSYSEAYDLLSDQEYVNLRYRNFPPSPALDQYYKELPAESLRNYLPDYGYRAGQPLSAQQCFDNVYKNCLERSSYTDEDVENVRLYLQSRFAITKPVKPVCQKLRVRRDFKCLSPAEMARLAKVLQRLYDNGVMDKFALIHGSWWPIVHKFADAILWHRWFINELELEMLKIDPTVTMPHWDFIQEFAAPELSSIWKFWGTAGTKENDYCLPDGVFANQRVKYPIPHCLRRQWNQNGTIPVWEPPEWKTSIMQTTTNNWPLFSQLISFTAHFKTHLHEGGWAGDMSIPYATNDPLFYPFHVHHADYIVLKWQLSDDDNLVPQSFNLGFRWNTYTRRVEPANINIDVLNYYVNTPVRETLQVGYGELCYIHDLLIKPINDIIRKNPLVLPPAVGRLKQTLPARAFASYYPKFVSNNATFFDYLLPDVGVCPPRDRCKPLPIALPYNVTANGNRQLDAFRYELNWDITANVFSAEYAYYSFMNDLNVYKYCSPYTI